QQASSMKLSLAIVYPLTSVLCLPVLVSCSFTPKLPPPPPRYVYQNQPTDETRMPARGSNSLYCDNASLYEDIKAHRLNDLVTINVAENISATGTADTTANKASSVDASISSLLGIPTNLNLPNLFGKGNTFSPTVNGSNTDAFTGSGETDRAASIVGTITGKVVEVMPNGILSIEARKEITFNNEKQTLILRGFVQPNDIAVDNSVLSSRISDAQVFFVGDGELQSKQNTGWLVKLMDKVWPF
ncbi:MAG TPA: flagellar basal body L-ring protein FlgH, partial [Nitrospirota bacterium]|nr:flagellar basal body L-ring protein FlgH [Nitrospirota bacterium]